MSEEKKTEKSASTEQKQPDESSADWQLQRDASKSLGDAAFRQGDYATAIHHYSAAISIDPEHAALLSNRSAAYLKTNQKSKALYDAQACVKLGTLGSKAHSRLAAALQSLGRHQQALESWKLVLEQDPNNTAAQQGVEDCTKALPPPEADDAAKEDATDDAGDDLDDFFNEVETAVETIHKEKIAEPEEQATYQILSHKKDLGTAAEQIHRLLADNYKWRNLNPFYVLDVPHTASKDDISKRYKALSLLLHPDKNRDQDQAQEAYDQVLKAKAMLDDETKANYNRQLAEQGMIQGKEEWDKSSKTESLESFQSKSVQRIFAEVEYARRDVAKREREFEQRQQQQEEEQLQKERNERTFDKKWKDDQRVEKRIGNWRDFATKKKKKSGV